MARSKRRIFVALAASVFVTGGLVACNGIIGLGDFQRTECTGNVCDASFDARPIVEAGPDTGGGTGDAGRGREAVSWARWRMPNYAVDGGLPNPPALTTSGDVVNDTITGLTWQNKLLNSGALLTLEEARAACTTSAGGPWRLPKRIELVTLLDFNRSSGEPLIGAAFGSGVQATRVWSSSEARQIDAGTKYWAVSFDDGKVTIEEGTQQRGAALCVKGQ